MFRMMCSLVPLTALLVLAQACRNGEVPPSDPGIQDSGAGTLDDTVLIHRDDRGVPHVRAQTDEGAMYGLGYASAQDRLAQMNLYARTTQGRMAEIMGAEFLDADLEARWIGYWRHAQQAADELPADEYALLQAFSDGVNAWVDAHPDALPSLFDTLDFEPQMWTPAHCLVSWYRVANLFSGTPYDKAQSYYDFKDLEASVGLQAAIDQTVGDLHAGDAESGVVQAEDVPQSVQDATHAYAAAHGFGPGANATPPNYGHDTPKFSHAWAVSGDRTSTGKAVLIADPQTAIAAPAIWYEWQLTGETLNVRGIGVAGTPALLIGFNDHIAWGLTAAGVDQSDLFRLQMVDADHYAVDGVSHAIDWEQETVLVKGEDAVQVVYGDTLFGPVVTPLVLGNRGDEWAFHGVPVNHADGDSFQGALGFMRAANLDELRASIDDWHYPSANLLAAAESGDIFFTVIGDIPLRSAASPVGGLIAQEGSSSVYEWADLIPADFKPWVLNPGQGYLLSANHRAAGAWYPLPVQGGQGASGHTTRSARLEELLEALPAVIEPEQMLTDVQQDCVNSSRRDIVRLARHIEGVDPGLLSVDALDFLKTTVAWSATGGSMETDVEAAGLPYALDLSFRAAKTGDEVASNYGGGDNGLNYFLDQMTAQLAADPTFVPEPAVVAYLDLILSEAWASAGGRGVDLDQLAASYAASATRDIGLFESSLTGLGIDATGVTILGPTAACQDGNTVWSQQGQSYSQFVDFEAVDSALAILPPGNSEDPASGWFDNQQDAWVQGEMLAAPLAPVVPSSSTDTVTLTWTSE